MRRSTRRLGLRRKGFGEPELAALVVRDLNDADALGEFGLGVAAFFPEPGDAPLRGSPPVSTGGNFNFDFLAMTPRV